MNGSDSTFLKSVALVTKNKVVECFRRSNLGRKSLKCWAIKLKSRHDCRES